MNRLITEQLMTNPFDDYIRPKQTTSKGGHIPCHLNAPIVKDESDFLLKYEKMHCKRHRELKSYIKGNNITNDIYNCRCDPYNCLAEFFLKTEDPHFTVEKSRVLMEQNLDTAFENATLHIKDVFQAVNVSPQAVDLSELRTHVRSKAADLALAYNNKRIVEHIKDTICNKEIKYGERKNFNGLIYDQDIAFFTCGTHKDTVIVPINLILCVLDIWQSRYNLLLYWTLCDGLNKYQKSIYEEGNKLIRVFEDLRFSYKEQFFKILNIYESLLIGLVVSDRINDLGFTGLKDNTKEELLEIITETEYQNLIPDLSTEDNIKLYLELTGITKSFGHPCLDLITGFNAVKEHSTKPITLDYNDIKNALWIWRRNFTLNYYKKHKKWPKVDKSWLCSSLKYYCKRNRFPVKLDKLPLEVWDTVVFEKNLEFDYTPDTSSLLKDSAISPDMEFWTTSYDHCAFVNLYGRSKPRLDYDNSMKRVISRFLESGESEAELIVKLIDSGKIDTNLLFYTLARKERELNIKGRFFCKQTYLLRLAQTCSEKNMVQILKYIPEQTMTNSELQLMNKHCSSVIGMTKNLEIINIDFEKWCLKFRHQLVSPFYRDFDRLFGMNSFFTNSHLWYTGGLVFLNSRFAPPNYDNEGNPMSGDYMFNNAQGGFEGMSQKKWTVITISIINYIAYKMKVRISILGQGDNQVIIIRYTEDQIPSKDSIRTRFLDELSTYSGRLNLKLKMKETWYSRRLFEYGKVRYFAGSAISQGTKKIARLIPDINDGLCSISTCISTINTTTESTAKGDTTPIPSFIINQSELLTFFQRRGLDKRTPLELQALTMFPSIMGGLNLSSLYQHMVRGYDDRLPLWLSLYKTISLHNPKLFHFISKLVTLDPTRQNPSRLLDDIFCLKLNPLPTVESKLKELVEKYLKSDHVTNPEITRLFDDSVSIDSQRLKDCLMSIRPFYPTIATELFRLSNAGIFRDSRNKFTNVQTINKTVQNETDTNFLTIINTNNYETIIQLNNLLNNSHTTKLHHNLNKHGHCPTHSAHQLRLEHWQLDMIGDTKSYPIHQMRLIKADLVTPQFKKKAIRITLSHAYTQSSLRYVHNNGPFHPYVGSSTQQKVQKANIEISNPTPYIVALKSLYTYKSWFNRYGDENFLNLFDELIREKTTDLPPEIEELDPSDWNVKVYGGNPLHRLQSLAERSTSGINSLPMSGSHVKYDTDGMTDFTKGGKDYTIFFQLCFNTLTSLLQLLKLFKCELDPVYYAIFDCEGCTTEISDIQLELKSPIGSMATVPMYSPPVVPTIHEPTHTLKTVNSWMSYLIGKEMGRDQDVNDQRLHLENTTDYECNPHKKSVDISLTEFRHVNYWYLVLGIMASSNRMLSLLSNQVFDLTLSGLDKTLTTIAQALIHSGTLVNCYHYFQVSIKGHYDCIDPMKISVLLSDAIVRYINNNRDKLIEDLVRVTFVDEDLHTLYNKFIWVVDSGVNYQDNCTHKYARSKIRSMIKYRQFDSITTLYGNTKYIIGREDLSIIQCDAQKIKLLWRQLYLKDPSFEVEQRHYEPPRTKTMWRFSILPQYNFDYITRRYSDILNCEISPLLIDIKNIHHVARPLGSISTSCNKVLECISAFKLDTVEVNHIFSMAEGSGGVLLLLRKIYKSICSYNTLLYPETDNRHSSTLLFPPAFINGSKADFDSLRALDITLDGDTNILSDPFQRKFSALCSLYNTGLVTIDAESKEDNNNFIFLKTYMPLIKREGIKIFINKMFLRVDIRDHIRQLVGPDYTCAFYKPVSSHINNHELYCIIVSNTVPLPILTAMRNFISENEDCHIKITCTPSILNVYNIDIYKSLCMEVSINLIKYNSNKDLDMMNRDFLTPLLHDGRICGMFCISLLCIVTRDLNLVLSNPNDIPPALLSAYRMQGRRHLLKTLYLLCNILLICRAYTSRARTVLLDALLAQDWYSTGGSKVQLPSPIIEEFYYNKSIYKRMADDNCNCETRERTDAVLLYKIKRDLEENHPKFTLRY